MDCFSCTVRAFGAISPVKITRQGLCWIAVFTGVLWGFLLFERITVDHARARASRALEEIRVLRMKRQAVPASSPTFRHRLTPDGGSKTSFS